MKWLMITRKVDKKHHKVKGITWKKWVIEKNICEIYRNWNGNESQEQINKLMITRVLDRRSMIKNKERRKKKLKKRKSMREDIK